jgi:hypothetical protein
MTQTRKSEPFLEIDTWTVRGKKSYLFTGVKKLSSIKLELLATTLHNCTDKMRTPQREAELKC